MQHPPDTTLITILVVIALLPLLYRRLRKLSRPQPLKLERLWIRPVMILAAAALVLSEGGARQVWSAWLPWLVLAAIAGALGGWQWGRTMAIEVHPEDGTLMARGGQAAVLVMVVLILLRVGLKTGAAMEANAWHLDVLLISDLSIVFSAALFTARSVEMYLRARRVLAGR